MPYKKCLELEKWWVSVNEEHGLHTKCCLIYHPPPCRSSQWLSLVIILLIAPKWWCFKRQVVLPKLTMCSTCSKNRVFGNMYCMPSIRGWAHASRHMNAARLSATFNLQSNIGWIKVIAQILPGDWCQEWRMTVKHSGIFWYILQPFYLRVISNVCYDTVFVRKCKIKLWRFAFRYEWSGGLTEKQVNAIQIWPRMSPSSLNPIHRIVSLDCLKSNARDETSLQSIAI